MRLTVLIVANIYHSWAEDQENNAVILVLSAILGYDHVDSRLAGRVERAWHHVVLVGVDCISEAAGNDDDFLGIALGNQWDEQVEEMDVGDDVDFEQVS